MKLSFGKRAGHRHDVGLNDKKGQLVITPATLPGKAVSLWFDNAEDRIAFALGLLGKCTPEELGASDHYATLDALQTAAYEFRDRAEGAARAAAGAGKPMRCAVGHSSFEGPTTAEVAERLGVLPTEM